MAMGAFGVHGLFRGLEDLHWFYESSVASFRGPCAVIGRYTVSTLGL